MAIEFADRIRRIPAYPLAALSTSPGLRRMTAVMTVFLVLTFAPGVTKYLSNHDINPLSTPAGRASMSLQNRLAG